MDKLAKEQIDEDIKEKILKFAEPVEKVTVVENFGTTKTIKSKFQQGSPAYKF